MHRDVLSHSCPARNALNWKLMSETLPPLIETPKGLYRHYKGGQYRVLGTVRHSEDLQAMTLYQALYGEQGLWVRPAAMFTEVGEFNGQVQPRFVRIGD